MQAVPPSPDSRPVTEGRTAPNVAVLDGVLKRVTFCNPGDVLHDRPRRPRSGHRAGPVSLGTERVTAVGPLLAAQVRESLRMWCQWASHQKYGCQFEFWSYATVPPATQQGIRRCLGSGLIKGIGPVMAERMVGRFGVDIMHVIDNEPPAWSRSPGCGRSGARGSQRRRPSSGRSRRCWSSCRASASRRPCGKCFTVRSVVELARARGATVILAAPPGGRDPSESLKVGVFAPPHMAQPDPTRPGGVRRPRRPATRRGEGWRHPHADNTRAVLMWLCSRRRQEQNGVAVSSWAAG